MKRFQDSPGAVIHIYTLTNGPADAYVIAKRHVQADGGVTLDVTWDTPSGDTSSAVSPVCEVTTRSLAELKTQVAQMNASITPPDNGDANTPQATYGIYRFDDVAWSVNPANTDKTNRQQKGLTRFNLLTCQQETILVGEHQRLHAVLNHLAAEQRYAILGKAIPLNQAETAHRVSPNKDGISTVYLFVGPDQKLCALLRQRNVRGRLKFQAGSGGAFNPLFDATRLARASDEQEEEFYGEFPLRENRLVRHAEHTTGHLVHLSGELFYQYTITDAQRNKRLANDGERDAQPDGWSMDAAIAIDNNPGDITKKLTRINQLNAWLYPFGDFFISALDHNQTLTLIEAKQTAQNLLTSYAQHETSLRPYMPQQIIDVLTDIRDSTATTLEALKTALITKYDLGFSDSTPTWQRHHFKKLADRTHEAMQGHSLSDYTESAQTVYVDAHALTELALKQRTQITAYNHDPAFSLALTWDDIFNQSAVATLLPAVLLSPQYKQQLGEKCQRVSQAMAQTGFAAGSGGGGTSAATLAGAASASAAATNTI